MTSITIPNSVTYLGKSCFYGCSGLTEVHANHQTPPATGADFFGGCNSLQTIYVPTGASANYDIDPWNAYKIVEEDVQGGITVDGISYNLDKENKTASVAPYNRYTGAVVIPETISVDGTAYSVTSLGEKCFFECSGLTSITIPNSVTSLGKGCFYKCTSLTNITIPNSVNSLGDWCFAYCSGLTSITIPNSVNSLGDKCFYYCI